MIVKIVRKIDYATLIQIRTKRATFSAIVIRARVVMWSVSEYESELVNQYINFKGDLVPLCKVAEFESAI